MNPMLKAALLALISAAVCHAQTPSAAQQKGSISGNVTNLAGDPVKGATLTLAGAQPPQFVWVASDAQGNFTFDDLEPGRYTLSSGKSGYLRGTYTGSSKSGVIDLASGETVTGIAIKMTPQSVISGRITDEYGDPYQTTVWALRWSYEGRQKLLQGPSGGGSNAEGIFAIGNLEPGSYYIVAGAFPLPILKGPADVTTYYPSVTDPSSAVAVHVAEGETARGIDIRIRKAPVYRVRGKLVDLNGGTAPAGANVQLFPKDHPTAGSVFGAIRSSADVRNGAFDIGGVLPGVYVLEAEARTSTSRGGARQIVTVGNGDVDDLVLQLGPGVEIAGKLSIDGAVPKNESLSVQLTVTEGMGVGGLDQTADDGTFAFHNILPAVYRAEVTPVPPGTYVKSIRFEGQDVTKATLDLTSGGGGTMSIALSTKVAQISGMVHGTDGMPLASTWVSLWTPGVPAEAADFTRTAQTDANGQFEFDSLPPGEYRVAAWEGVMTPGLGTFPEFRIKFESQAAAVKLEEGAHENVEAPLIGRDAIATEAARLQ
jgi:hypothetical protein